MKNYKYFMAFAAMLVLIFSCKRENKLEAGDNAVQPVKEETVEKAIVESKISPPLEIDGGAVYDIGRLFNGEERLLVLKLRNGGNAELKLLGIEADCSCTNIVGIPEPIVLSPGEVYKMPIRVDSGKISIGKFERHIFVFCEGYSRYSITIKGEVKNFYMSKPSNRRMHILTKGNPDASWISSVELYGIDEAEGKLELALDNEQENKHIKVELEKLEDGKWKISTSPKKPLPYTRSYSSVIKIKVVKPDGFPSIPIYATGKVGTDIIWHSRNTKLSENDFKEGYAALKFQLGYDPQDTSAKVTQKTLSAVEDVDWQKLFDTLEFRAPEGVECVKTYTRFGVRLDVKIPRTAFDKKGSLKIESGCNGNWEGKPIVVKISSEKDADRKQKRMQRRKLQK